MAECESARGFRSCPRVHDFDGSADGRNNRRDWDEFDLAQKIWTVPGERMKAGKEHKVPLCASAIEILKGLPREKNNPMFVFIENTGQYYGRHGDVRTAKGMTWQSTTPGMAVPRIRRSAIGRPSKRRSPTLVKMAIAHAIESGTERAYRRGELMEKRRKLMDAWERYCNVVRAAKGDNVTPIRGKAS